MSQMQQNISRGGKEKNNGNSSKHKSIKGNPSGNQQTAVNGV